VMWEASISRMLARRVSDGFFSEAGMAGGFLLGLCSPRARGGGKKKKKKKKNEIVKRMRS